ncbi:MAG: class I SAM-dependent methyltransferase [Spirochaetia bacterium]
MNLMNRIKMYFLNRKAKKTMDAVLQSLPLEGKKAIADLGSGGGEYTLSFAKNLRKGGQVYAVDINGDHLSHVRKQVKKAGLHNKVTFVLAEEKDCLLEKESVDFVFSRNSYHHIPEPEKYFIKVAKALKPKGELALIDYDGSSGSQGPHGHHAKPEEIRRNMETAGLRFKQAFDHLPGQSFQIFVKPE